MGEASVPVRGCVSVAHCSLPAFGSDRAHHAGSHDVCMENLMSHFFAYLSRMKFIKRWGLMHNTYPENIQEHSLRVAMIAHALAVIRNRVFDGAVNPERTAVLALYHDASEVLTGDLPAPVKYFNPEIKTAYKAIEAAAGRTLFQMLPAVLQADYQGLFMPDEADRMHHALVTAADKLCAYLKCLEEVGAGNPEFAKAEKALRASVDALALPEVRYFLDTFVPSFRLTLDELE
jgi:5'-deoxynucleotidase